MKINNITAGLKNIHYSVFYYSLILLSFALPFYSNLTNVLIIVLTLNWIIEGQFIQKLQAVRGLYVVIILSFFAIHCFALIQTENLKVGFFNIEKKIPLLVLPLILATSNHKINQIDLDRILNAFVISTFIVSLACIFRGIYLFFSQNTVEFLTYEGLIDWTGLQPTYFSIYVSFSGIILLNNLFKDSYRHYRWALLGILFYFIVFNFLAAARTPLAAFLVLLFAGGIYYGNKAKRNNLLLPAFFILAIVIAFIAFKIPFLQERITSLIGTKFEFNPLENNANGLTLRLVKWECSIDGFLSNPIFGVGIGDMQDVLQACYKKKDFWGQVFEYNSHNQYLQTALGMGIIGLISLLICLMIQLKSAYRSGQFVDISFIIIISICFLTESILERKQGVMFYGLFSSIFIFKRNNS